jgi:DNA mismatch endonuclease, patch repair protein
MPRPEPLSTAVSRQMSRMPSRGSGPELQLRRELHRRGLRFRVQAALPGRPDIVLSRARLAIFVDGCFWHLCPSHGTLPKNNADWWRTKLERNVARDREKDRLLSSQGWLPLHVWEHEDVPAAADGIAELWRQRTGRPRA